jgi:hypothetical protein
MVILNGDKHSGEKGRRRKSKGMGIEEKEAQGAILFYFYYIIVILRVYCDIYRSAYNIF